MLHLRALENHEVNRRKEIIKIREDTKEMEMKKKTKKPMPRINETRKELVLSKAHRIDKPLAKLT